MEWDKPQQEAFSTAKEMLQRDSLLVYFDPVRKLVLACDASPYGVGAILSHVMDDQSDIPYDMHPEHCRLLRKDTHSWTMKVLRFSLESRKFIPTNGVDHSPFVQTISHYIISST